MGMADAMVYKLYGVKLPGAIQTVACGTFANVVSPIHGEVNLGECLVSVHAAQIPSGMMKDTCIGLAGVPFNLGKEAREMLLANRVDGYQVTGSSTTIVQVDGHTDYFAPGPSVSMLGHAIILRRDEQQNEDNAYSVSPDGVAMAGERAHYGNLVPHERINRYAFSRTDNFDDLDGLYLTHLELYSDFDWINGTDLALVVPNTEAGKSTATSKDKKERMVAYVAADLQLDELRGRSTNLLTSKVTKRARLED
jgi:hypothetical protein